MSNAKITSTRSKVVSEPRSDLEDELIQKQEMRVSGNRKGESRGRFFLNQLFT